MQPSTSQEALKQLQSYQASRRKPQDILQERETSLGVPTSQQRLVGLRGAIQNTENLLKGVDPSVSGRTQGSLVTEAQKQRLISLEREPIAGQLNDQNRSLENENANYNELSRRALQDAQLQIASDDQQQNSLQGLYGTLYQREQDDIARQERERAFQAQQAEARRQAAASSSLASLLNGGAGSPQKAAPKTDPVQQAAYNDVATRVNSQSDDQLRSDYAATLKSANYGNLKDKLKIQLYSQLRPDLFAGVPSTVVTSNALSY